jgi:hypothetical protein
MIFYKRGLISVFVHFVCGFYGRYLGKYQPNQVCYRPHSTAVAFKSCLCLVIGIFVL